jgi:hypothetical protein
MCEDDKGAWLFSYVLKGATRLFPNITVTAVLRGNIAQGVPYAATIYDLLCILFSDLIIPGSYTRALWQLPAETRPTSSEAGETWQEMTINFAYDASLIPVGLFNML